MIRAAAAAIFLNMLLYLVDFRAAEDPRGRDYYTAMSREANSAKQFRLPTLFARRHSGAYTLCHDAHIPKYHEGHY
jgi:hypothetical protein